MIVCPKCKKFVSKVRYWINGFEEITKVVGTCKKHGEVEPTNWEYEDLVPEESQ